MSPASLAATGLPPSVFELEITMETVIQTGPATVESLAAGCGALGASIALDDFGIGYFLADFARRAAPPPPA